MKLSRYAEADLPTAYGSFRLYVYRAGEAVLSGPTAAVDAHMAIAKGDVNGGTTVLFWCHPDYWTSEVLGSVVFSRRHRASRGGPWLPRAG